MPNYSAKMLESIIRQTSVIERSTNQLLERQIRGTEGILVSSENTSRIVNLLHCEVHDLKNGLHELGWRLSDDMYETVWQLEQINAELLEITEILSAPLATRSRELRNRGLKAFSDGLYEDALDDLKNAASLNRYDFIVHITIGMIYWRHLDDVSQAIDSFQKSVRYAKPDSPYYASYALLNLMQIEYAQGNFSNALEHALQARDLAVNSPAAHYACAQCYAALEDRENALEVLKRCLRMDVRYALRSYNDGAFTSFQSDLEGVYGALAEELEVACQEAADYYGRWTSEVYEAIERCSRSNRKITWEALKKNIVLTSEAIEQAQALAKRHRLLDSVDAFHILYFSVPSRSSGLIADFGRAVKDKKTSPPSYTDMDAWIYVLGREIGFLLGLALGFRGCVLASSIGSGFVTSIVYIVAGSLIGYAVDYVRMRRLSMFARAIGNLQYRLSRLGSELPDYSTAFPAAYRNANTANNTRA
ncbi:MAG: tetratricopeptide repeat protein [Spirochaetota bacterium]